MLVELNVIAGHHLDAYIAHNETNGNSYDIGYFKGMHKATIEAIKLVIKYLLEE